MQISLKVLIIGYGCAFDVCNKVHASLLRPYICLGHLLLYLTVMFFQHCIS